MDQQNRRELILVPVTPENELNPEEIHPELVFLRVRDPATDELLFVGLEEAEGCAYLAFRRQEFQFRIVIFKDN